MAMMSPASKMTIESFRGWSLGHDAHGDHHGLVHFEPTGPGIFDPSFVWHQVNVWVPIADNIAVSKFECIPDAEI